MGERKVYCDKCIHFDGGDDCEHHLNLSNQATWKTAVGITHLLKPSVINIKNNCGWFSTS